MKPLGTQFSLSYVPSKCGMKLVSNDKLHSYCFSVAILKNYCSCHMLNDSKVLLCAWPICAGDAVI